MAFGQASGPPATHKQVQHLLELLVRAGHEDFRDARGPMGFTQRQAAGKFTRDEADEFIERLEVDEQADDGNGTRSPMNRPAAAATPDRALRSISSERLAAELQGRGWIVIEP